MFTRYYNLFRLSLAICCSLSFQSSYSTIIYVQASHAPGGNGSSWANAFQDLQLALNVAAAGDQIWVAKGSYFPSVPLFSGNDSRLNTFRLKSSVALYGGFAGTENRLSQRNLSRNPTILDGNIGSAALTSDNCYHVVLSLNNYNSILDGFIVRNGNASWSAGLTFEGRQISFSQGAGIFITYSSIAINNCVFDKNTAAYQGGAVFTDNATCGITSCVFASNITTAGGGALISTGSGSPVISNCTFTNNTTYTASGNCIYSSSPSMTIVNSIFWGYAGSVSNMISGAATVTYSIVQGGTAAQNINPLFANIADPDGADNTWGTADDGLRLLPGSPALNAGSNAALPTGTPGDITSVVRIQNGTVDMGAYETGSISLPLQLLSFTAQKNDADVLLEWKTTNEENTAYFIIERSVDATTFTAIGRVPSENLAGTHTYRFTNANATGLAPKIYYRLQQVDRDAYVTYSPIARIASGNNTGEVSLYHNPVYNQTSLNIQLANPQQVQLSIMDNIGRTVQQSIHQLAAGYTLLPLPVSKLAKGLYYVVIKGNTINQRISFLKP